MLWALRYLRYLKILVFKIYMIFCLIEALPLNVCTILSFPHIFHIIFEFVSSKLKPRFSFFYQKIMIEFQHKIIFCLENFYDFGANSHWLYIELITALPLEFTYHSTATAIPFCRTGHGVIYKFRKINIWYKFWFQLCKIMEFFIFTHFTAWQCSSWL